MHKGLAFIQGTFRAWYARYFDMPLHIREQVEWRASRCPGCLEAKKCSFCRCKTPDLFFADKACAGGRYPAMMDEDAWIDYKKNNSHEFTEL